MARYLGIWSVAIRDIAAARMQKRRSFNPKRRLSQRAVTPEEQDAFRQLAGRVRYGGNPEHKRNPGDFGLDPPSLPRLGKSLCDDANVSSRSNALDLLRSGFAKGLVSTKRRGEWPQNVWAVTREGQPVEAQLEADGVYHGYPMPQNDPFREEILARWK